MLKNHNRFAVVLKGVSVRVKWVRAPHATGTLPCTAADFRLRGYVGRPIAIAPGSTTLKRAGIASKRWPRVGMAERPVNQDGCMGATVELSYRGVTVKGARRR